MELTHFYQSKGWNDSLEIGNKLAQIVLKAHPHTPGEEIKVFVQCLNYILNGQANCSLERKESQRMGYFTQRIALIEVGPARRPTNSR